MDLAGSIPALPVDGYRVPLDLGRLSVLTGVSRSALAGENLFRPKQLALFEESTVKPKRANGATE